MPADAGTLESLIARRRDEQVRFLAELVRVPSDNPPGDCALHAGRTASLLEALGFQVKRYPVAPEACHAQGMQSVVNLVVRERFGDGPVVALNAHGDVVEPGEGWSVDPYGAEVRDGVMLGRGVAVSKSDIATYAFALRALRELGAPLRGTVELHVTYDEETGGFLGPRWLLAEGLTHPDFAVVAGFSYGVVTHHNGCLHLQWDVLGCSAHAAEPASGVDALEAATAVLGALYAHRRELTARRSAVPGIRSPTLNVGRIEGGINTNVVPDRVVLRIDRRVIPEEDPEQVESGLRTLLGETLAPFPGVRSRCRRVMYAAPLKPVGEAAALAALVGRHAERVLGEPVPAHGVPLYTDARHYMAAGIPTVCYGAGPRTVLEANGHRADERLVLDDLFRATRVVAAALHELLTRGGV